MKSSRIPVMVCVAAAIAALAAGCSDVVTPVDDITARAPQSSTTARLDQESAVGESARARFHRRNKLDFVGVAHNAALAQYATRLHSGAVTGNMCDDILAFVAKGSFMPAEAHAKGAEVRAATARVMSSIGACATPSTSRKAALSLSAGDMSPEASALVSQIDAAITTSATSTDLAAALLPILDAAAQLAPAEADAVSAGASVALSSQEYWEVTLTPGYVSAQTADISAAYGDCLSQFSTAEQAVGACLGLQAPRAALPTAFTPDGHIAPSMLRLVYGGCPKPNLREIVHMDYAGAMGGAFVAIWTGGIAVIPAAIGGAVGASTAEASWQTALGAWCYGGAAIREVMKT